MDPKACFTALPVELIIRILLQLHVLDVVVFQRVSKACRCIVKDSVPLQYKIECFLADVIDGPASKSMSLVEKFHNVQQWRQAWRTLKWTEQSSAIFPLPMGWPTSHFIGSVYADINSQAEDAFEFYQIGSGLRRIPSKRWRVQNCEGVESFYDAWIFDLEEDLIVLPVHHEGEALLELFPVSCTTGESHPSAAAKALKAKTYAPIRDNDPGLWSLHLRVCGDMLGFVVIHDRLPSIHCEIWIYNWKQGRLLLNVYSEKGDGMEIQDMKFLDQETVIITILGEHACVAIVHRDCFPANRIRFKDAAASSKSLVLEFPEVAEDRWEYSFVMVEVTPRRSVVKEDAVFKSACANAVVLVSLNLMHRDLDAERSYDLLIPSRVIRTLMDNGKGQQTVSWSAWRQECRMFDVSRSDTIGDAQVHTSRYITTTMKLALPDPDAQRRTLMPVVTIYDFDSIPALKKDVATGDAEVVLEESFLRERGVWKDDVVTAAPYRRIVSDIYVGPRERA